MDERQLNRSEPLDHELIEPLSTAGWSIALILFRPVPRFRSPIMEPRPFRPLPRDQDGREMTIPGAGDVIRPMGWALLLAIPVFVLVGWQVALFVALATAIIRAVDGRIARSSLSFADGFIGFRSESGWPKGVQEDDDVRWNWS